METGQSVAVNRDRYKVTAVGGKKWFTETGESIAVTDQIHGRPYYT